MKVTVTGKALRQQLGANDLSVFEDEASRSFVGENHGGNAGDEQWIAQAQQDRSNDGEEN
jgi:hypothetical protein